MQWHLGDEFKSTKEAGLSPICLSGNRLGIALGELRELLWMRSGEAGGFIEFSSPRSELSRQLLALGKNSFPRKRVQWVSDALGESTRISSPLRVTLVDIPRDVR